MLILILIDVHYLQNVHFNFEKGLNVQNHSSASYRSLEKSPSKNFPSPNGENPPRPPPPTYAHTYPLTLFNVNAIWRYLIVI